MKFEIDIQEINSKKALKIMKETLRVRDDWHEPDEEGVNVLITGKSFDNAGSPDEIHVIVTQEGKPIFAVNLATLLAFATDYEGEE